MELVSSNLKKVFEKVIQKRIKLLSSLGVTPNHITVLGVLVSLVTMWLYINWWRAPSYLLVSTLTILLSGLLDAIDGVLARSTGKVSKFGGFFDSISDRYSDAITLSGVILGGLCTTFVGLAAIIGSLMVSYTRSRAEMEGVKMSGIGLAERAERMIFLATCSTAAYFWLPSLQYGMLILALVAHGTVLQRAIYFKKNLRPV